MAASHSGVSTIFTAVHGIHQTQSHAPLTCVPLPILRELTAEPRTRAILHADRKEIDHALERIAAIGKRVGIDKEIAAQQLQPLAATPPSPCTRRPHELAADIAFALLNQIEQFLSSTYDRGI
jgi:hypothetical protein